MNLKGLSVLLFTTFSFLIFSCTKINEATELGGDLIPAVDNVNTFDTTISLEAAYHPFEDTSKLFLGENMALGKITDPTFGSATADMYFNLSSSVYGTNPYKVGDSAVVDSVVLSLGFTTGYGDTTATGLLNVQVFEIASGNGFEDSVLYRLNQPGFTTTGSALGSAAFSIPRLQDSIRIGTTGHRISSDSASVANVLRIRLNNSLGNRLKSFDTAANGNGGYYNDSTFRKLFRGLAVKTQSANSAFGTFAYFNLSDAKSTLKVYYHNSIGGVKDTATATYVHNVYSQANSITRSPGGAYLANINNPNAQNFYIQSSPSGSYVGIKVPNLENFPNKVIHRAELIAAEVSDPYSTTFPKPNLLYLDHKGPSQGTVIDTAYFFEKDIASSATGGFDYASFGGRIKTDNTYRFNITRYVQGIVTRKERNDSLRLYAPYRVYNFEPSSKLLLAYPYNNILDYIAKGRVVIAGTKNPDPNKRLRLHIIYSNL